MVGLGRNFEMFVSMRAARSDGRSHGPHPRPSQAIEQKALRRAGTCDLFCS
jgi:hypothetical protein